MKLSGKILSFVLMSLFLLLETGIPMYKSMCCKHDIHTSLYFDESTCNQNHSDCCGHRNNISGNANCCSNDNTANCCKDIDCNEPANDCGNTKRDVAKLSIDIHNTTNFVSISDICPMTIVVPMWYSSGFLCLNDNIADNKERDNNLIPYNYGRKMKIFLNQLSISPRPC